MVAQFTNFNNDFRIGDYLSKLTASKKKGFYVCPACHQEKLSINKDRLGYDCYNCGDRKAIARELTADQRRKKEPRPKQYREWMYFHKDTGERLFKVCRWDDPDNINDPRIIRQEHWTGKEWKSGYGDRKREDAALYQYNEVKTAIANKQTIFIVEGEPCADALRQLGLVATCNIGGSGKWLPLHSQSLQGADVVLVPDQDAPGIKHMESINQDFPNAKWLYIPICEYQWGNLPSSKGLDIGDWINDDKASKDEILKAISDKKEFVKPVGDIPKNNVVYHPKMIAIDIADIDALIENGVTGSKLIQKLTELGGNNARILYDQRLKELQREDDIKSQVKNLEKLVKATKNAIDLNYIFPHQIAKALIDRAESDRIDPMVLAQNLMPACGSMIGSKISLQIKKGWKEYATFYSVIIGGVSTGKTPSMKAIYSSIYEKQLREEMICHQNREKLKEIKEEWAEMSKKDRDGLKGSPQDPKRFKEENPTVAKKWVLDDGSIEGLLKRISEQDPTKGTVLVADELKGFFLGLDQHKASKGNARQKILSAWNGPLKMIVDRVNSEEGYFINGQTFSICGGIQNEMAHTLFNAKDDPDGLMARFLPHIMQIPKDFAVWSDREVDIDELLVHLYDQLEGLPEQTVTFAPDANKYWKSHWESIRRAILSYQSENPAYAGFLGKQISYIPRLALVLHLMDVIYNGADLERCSLSALERAIALSNHYCGQFRILQSQSRNQDSLDGVLLKVHQLLQKEQSLTVRVVCQRLHRHTYEGEKIGAAIAKDLLISLAEKGYGVWDGKTLSLQTNAPEPPQPEPVVEARTETTQRSQESTQATIKLTETSQKTVETEFKVKDRVKIPNLGDPNALYTVNRVEKHGLIVQMVGSKHEMSDNLIPFKWVIKE